MNNIDANNELIGLVRKLQNTVNTLEQHIGELDAKVKKLNYLSKLLDVSIDSITFGDILQYSNDGKWHNIQPNKIISPQGCSITSAHKLADLEDVEISSPVNNQTLTYSSTDSKWHNNTASGGGGSIDPGALTGYLTKVEASTTYFPLTGGTINGGVRIEGNLLTTGGVTLYGK